MFHIHQWPVRWSEPKITATSYRLFQEKICATCGEYKIKWIDEGANVPYETSQNEVKEKY